MLAPKPDLRPSGIGIDCVDLTRARRFLKDHPKSFARLLSPLEKKRWKSKSPSALSFAKLFAAKEAFFKALDGVWMGLEGFARLEVSCFPKGRFKVQSLPSVSNNPGGFPAGKWGKGRFFKVPGGMAAEVICWKNSDALASS